MSTLSFTLRQAPHQAVNLSALQPSKLAGLSSHAIERLELGSGHTAQRSAGSTREHRRQALGEASRSHYLIPSAAPWARAVVFRSHSTKYG